MSRRLTSGLAASAVLVLVLAACGSSTPAISDPKEIITQGFQATSDATSFHVEVALDGTISIPDSGGSFSLDGTTLAGDLDLEGKEGQLTFAVPALLSLSGELIFTEDAGYFKTSMSGDQYQLLPLSSGDPVSEAMDPEKALADLRDFLNKEGVVSEKLDDVNCGDGKCYAVRVTVPSELLADAGAAASMDPSEIFGDAMVLDLRFDRDKLYLMQASTSVDSETAGTFSVTVNLSDYNEPVDVSPPPSDQITESPGAFPF